MFELKMALLANIVFLYKPAKQNTPITDDKSSKGAFN